MDLNGRELPDWLQSEVDEFRAIERRDRFFVGAVYAGLLTIAGVVLILAMAWILGTSDGEPMPAGEQQLVLP